MLYPGDNVITVTAYDSDGNVATDTLTASYILPDAVPLVCNIKNPTSNQTVATNWHMVSIGGTASDDKKVVNVTWSNSLGGSGTMHMTPQSGGPNVSWQSRGNVMLYPGDNVITVTAYDSDGNSATDVLNIAYDSGPPVCTILLPTSDSTYHTVLPYIFLEGSAQDSDGIACVSWVNMANGASGVEKTGTEWSTIGIPLNPGLNQIFVNATDNAGSIGSDSIWVTYLPELLEVEITAPTSDPNMVTGWKMINLRGTASDDTKVVRITWERWDDYGGYDFGDAYMNPQSGGPSVSWQSRGNLVLAPGNNVIYVCAYDSTGNISWASLTVWYTGN
jgi:hypothetical protein